MFSHVRIGSNDVARARDFYDGALGALGLRAQDMAGSLLYATEGGMFVVGAPLDGAATHANGGTIGFNAGSHEAVDAFHAAGLANGGTCEGAPGVREGYGIYAAYLRDLDGNKICAVAPAG